MEPMGYRNTKAVYDLNMTGRLANRRGDNLSIYPMAELIFMYMADQTYDWDRANNQPPEKQRQLGVPCRYYKLGWRDIAQSFGMVALTPEQAMSGHADEIKRRRENSVKKTISDAFIFLQQRGAIKKLEPASLGLNAGFLLLLGGEEENRAVERWARQCLNLPMVW